MSMRVVRGVCLLWIVFLSFALAASDRSSSTEAFILTIDQVKTSVVPILCGKFDENNQFAVQLIDGTGFFVDDKGDFLTAAHVIADLKVVSTARPTPCVMAIYVPNDGWQRDAVTFSSRWYAFGNCILDTSLDLAVCKTIGTISTPVHPLVVEDLRPPDGSPVAFTGFPLGSIEPVSSRCDIAAMRGATDAEGSRELVLDKGTWPGASGSPIYTQDGVVVGIMLARGIADNTGTAYGRPSHFIVKFLRANNIQVPADNRNHKSKK